MIGSEEIIPVNFNFKNIIKTAVLSAVFYIENFK